MHMLDRSTVSCIRCKKLYPLRSSRYLSTHVHDRNVAFLCLRLFSSYVSLFLLQVSWRSSEHIKRPGQSHIARSGTCSLQFCYHREHSCGTLQPEVSGDAVRDRSVPAPTVILHMTRGENTCTAHNRRLDLSTSQCSHHMLCI